MDLGDWTIHYTREGHNELAIWNRADARSRAWMRCPLDERRAGNSGILIETMIDAIRRTNAYLAETGRAPFNMNAALEAAQAAGPVVAARNGAPTSIVGYYSEELHKAALMEELNELMAGNGQVCPNQV